MLSLTQQAIEKFDNQHDFERMCADILNQLGYTKVTPIAPKGGSDGGKDITYVSYDSKSKGLACCSVRADYKKKFDEDFGQRKKGEFEEYYFFTNRYTTHAEKMAFKHDCLDRLDADVTIIDQEALRSLLDTAMQDIRNRYMPITTTQTVNPEGRQVSLTLSEVQILYLKLVNQSDDKRLSILRTMGGEIIESRGRVKDAEEIVRRISEFDTQEVVAELNELVDSGIFESKYGKHSTTLVLTKQGYSAIRQIKEQEANLDTSKSEI